MVSNAVSCTCVNKYCQRERVEPFPLQLLSYIRILKIFQETEQLLTMSNSSFSNNALKHESSFSSIIYITKTKTFAQNHSFKLFPSQTNFDLHLQMNDNQQICLFPPCLHHYFSLAMFNVVCCRFSICGKGFGRLFTYHTM